MGAFDGKVAVVTGGGSGLGEAIGKRLAADGASVVPTDINREAPLVRFLLSDEASFITGGYYLVDGGYTAV